MLTYQVEPLTAELESEMAVFGEDYHKEVTLYHNFPIDVWKSVYIVLQEKGFLVTVTARDESKSLKGFGFSTVAPHSHYACISGTVSLFYLAPDCRKGREGIRLIRKIEQASVDAGAQIVLFHGRTHNETFKLFESLGYKDFDRIYMIIRDDGPNGNNPVFKKKDN